ncbi:hypothetical protein IIA16_00410 [bacterium]|nr:hypothetical protein [bacterium]
MTDPLPVATLEETPPATGGDDRLMVLRPAVVRAVLLWLLAWFLLRILGSYLSYALGFGGWVEFVVLFPSTVAWLMALLTAWMWSNPVLAVGADRLSQYVGSGGRLDSPQFVLKYEQVGKVAIKRSPTEVVFGLGTLEITYREGCGPVPMYKSQKVSSVAIFFPGLVQPHVVARDLWERISAHNEDIDRPGPPATLQL